MRAVIWDRYGPPEILRLEDVERPEPADDEVLVRVHASSVNRTDTGLRAGKPFIVRFFTGFRKTEVAHPRNGARGRGRGGGVRGDRVRRR